MAENGNSIADLVIARVPKYLAKELGDFLKDHLPDWLTEAGGIKLAAPRDTYTQIAASVQARMAAYKEPDEVLFKCLTALPLLMEIAKQREGYRVLRAAEYDAKKKDLIEIPDPGTITRAMINLGNSFHGTKKDVVSVNGMHLHGLGSGALTAHEVAARTPLDAASVWRAGLRINRNVNVNFSEMLGRCGLPVDQLKILTSTLETLMPVDLLARLAWRGEIEGQPLKDRMAELGVFEDYIEQWLQILESVLPPDLAVRGEWREKWDRAETLKRLKAIGMRENDRGTYADLSTTLLPADLIARGLWWKRDTAEEALDRMTALGVDRKDAAEYLVRMQSVTGGGDLARLFYAGQIDENGYVDGLERLGLATDDALSLVKWPWQPIPASEALRLLLADKLDPEDAKRALRTTGMPPETAAAIVAWPYRPTGLGETKLLFNRGAIHSGGAAERLKAGGLRPDDAEVISLNLNDPLPVDALFQLHRRGKIDRESMVADLIRHGYAGDAADRLADLCWIVPSPSDVITFAIRDVFEEDVVKHFGYDEEFPETFVEWAKKAGIPREVAQLHWWAHWYVPGVGEVFNMFHRIKPGQEDVPREDRITWVMDEDVDMYLKTQDYPPWWREPLKAISYHPISRIDIRRAYQDGLADEEDVYNTNRALGYSHRDATILTDWTKWAYMPEDEALLLAKVRDGLVDGSLDTAGARDLLTQIDLPADRIDLVLDWAEYERESKKKDLTRATVQRLYVDGYIDEVDLRTRLAALNYAGEEIELLLALWSIDREAAATVKGVLAARPSRAQVTRFWTRGVIGERAWAEEMTGLGYNDTYIAWFREDLLKDWTEDTLGDYFTKGLLSAGSLRGELSRRGWLDEQIDSLLAHLRGG